MIKKGPKHKICRRAGFCLFGKAKCPSVKRPYPPGAAGKKRKKLTLFGNLLWEKQKIRATYNISEKQFKNLALAAKKMKGRTGDTLLKMCETRTDNMVFKMGFAPTIFAARQAVVHGHFTLNGHAHTSPSALLKPGDKIALRRPEKSEFLKNYIKEAGFKKNYPSYVEINPDEATGILSRVPEVDEIYKNGIPEKVIEFYSR